MCNIIERLGVCKIERAYSYTCALATYLPPNKHTPIPNNKPNNKPQVTKVKDTKALQTECLEKEMCLLVMKGKRYGQKEERVLAGAYVHINCMCVCCVVGWVEEGVCASW